MLGNRQFRTVLATVRAVRFAFLSGTLRLSRSVPGAFFALDGAQTPNLAETVNVLDGRSDLSA